MRDYRRYRPTTLFAALDTARGTVISQFDRFCLCFLSGTSKISRRIAQPPPIIRSGALVFPFS
jgi:hypothetical protein